MKVKAGTLYSHLANEDEVKELCGASLLLILTALSWYFRPVTRKNNFG